MSDFELSIVEAAGEVFPLSTKSCCFFHFLQCIIRRFQEKQHHYYKLYRSENQEGHDTKLNVRLIAALAFVLIDDVYLFALLLSNLNTINRYLFRY